MTQVHELTKESKIKLFTHNDLDGIGCEIVGRLAFPNIDVIIVKNPKDASEKVAEFVETEGYKDFDKVFITDISVDLETALMINKLQNIEDIDKFQLLDHHSTATELNQFHWASVREYNPLRHGKNSGTNLFFDYLMLHHDFFRTESYRDALTIFVEKVRRYDTWEWKEEYDDQDAMMLNQLLWLLGHRRFVTGFIKKFNEDIFVVSEGSWLKMFSPADTAVITVDTLKKEDYIDRKEKQMIVKNLLGYRIGVVFSEQYTSELGNVLSERYPELKFIVMVDMGSRKVSYRTTHNDIKLGQQVAKVFGGGGHPKASGSEFGESVLNIAFLAIFAKGFVGKLLKLVDRFSKN